MRATVSRPSTSSGQMETPRPLTARQAQVLRYMIWYFNKHGRCARHTEISLMAGATDHPSLGYHYVQVLEAKGYVRQTADRSRAAVPIRDERGYELKVCTVLSISGRAS